MPSDDARSIDWKATLRSNETLVKQFSEERNLNVFFLIDVSSTMFFGSTSKLKNEYAAELAASLCFAVLKAGDTAGFALFADKIIKKSMPIKSNKQFYFLLRTLTNPKNYGGGCNFRDAIKFAMNNIKHSSLLVIISDFIGVGNDWQRFAKIASKKFEVMGVMVRDPRDITLPSMNRLVLLEDPISGRQLLIHPESIRVKYNKYVIRQEKMISEEFKKMGAGFVSLSTDKFFLKPMMHYFNLRLKRFI